MKKISIIILSILLLYIIIRIVFSYTIINVPYVFGTRTYVGNSKYDFPICIVNPIKTKHIKNIILQHVKQEFEAESQILPEEIKTIKYAANYKLDYDKKKYRKICYYEDLRRFFGEQDTLKDFDIISVAVSIEEIAVNKNVNSFLLQQKENPEKKCVVIFEKKSDRLLRFGF